MYYCLRSVAPWLNETARVAGSVAFLFNMYVALNSQAQIVWLLTYGTLPAMVGVTACAMRGEMNVWRGRVERGAARAGRRRRQSAAGRHQRHSARDLRIGDAGVQPRAGDYGKTHAAVPCRGLRGDVLGQSVLARSVRRFLPLGLAQRRAQRGTVASQRGDVVRQRPARPRSLGDLCLVRRASRTSRGRRRTRRASSARCFGSCRSSRSAGSPSNATSVRRRSTFMLATIVSVPIVVGYYHDALGDAVTTPIYDAFYRYFPGFQMFRFSYKWVAGVEFGISGLYALAVYSIVTWLREQRAFWIGTANERFGSVVPAAGAVLVAVADPDLRSGLDKQDELSRYGLAELGVSRKRVGRQRRSASRCAVSDAVSRTIRLGEPPVLHRELA